jgi:hypothetical protein
MPGFLAANSVCGKDLLSLVSRGSAIIAELLRLGDNIPPAVLPGAERDPQLAKYKPVLFDFRWGCLSRVFRPCSPCSPTSRDGFWYYSPFSFGWSDCSAVSAARVRCISAAKTLTVLIGLVVNFADLCAVALVAVWCCCVFLEPPCIAHLFRWLFLRKSGHCPSYFVVDWCVTHAVAWFGDVCRYKRTPERFDEMVNHSVELSEINEEFVTTHEAVLARFYTLFDSVYRCVASRCGVLAPQRSSPCSTAFLWMFEWSRYVSDYQTFLNDLSSGSYVENSVDTVMLDNDGKRLMCEALYLLGVMLLFMDLRIPGPIREVLIIAHFRHKVWLPPSLSRHPRVLWPSACCAVPQGEGLVPNIDEVVKLCRSTGYVPGEKRPPNYPDELFARFPIPEPIVLKIIDRLRSDDIYDLTR